MAVLSRRIAVCAPHGHGYIPHALLEAITDIAPEERSTAELLAIVHALTVATVQLTEELVTRQGPDWSGGNGF